MSLSTLPQLPHTSLSLSGFPQKDVYSQTIPLRDDQIVIIQRNLAAPFELECAVTGSIKNTEIHYKQIPFSLLSIGFLIVLSKDNDEKSCMEQFKKGWVSGSYFTTYYKNNISFLTNASIGELEEYYFDLRKKVSAKQKDSDFNLFFFELAYLCQLTQVYRIIIEYTLAQFTIKYKIVRGLIENRLLSKACQKIFNHILLNPQISQKILQPWKFNTITSEDTTIKDIITKYTEDLVVLPINNLEGSEKIKPLNDEYYNVIKEEVEHQKIIKEYVSEKFSDYYPKLEQRNEIDAVPYPKTIEEINCDINILLLTDIKNCDNLNIYINGKLNLNGALKFSEVIKNDKLALVIKVCRNNGCAIVKISKKDNVHQYYDEVAHQLYASRVRLSPMIGKHAWDTEKSLSIIFMSYAGVTLEKFFEVKKNSDNEEITKKFVNGVVQLIENAITSNIYHENGHLGNICYKPADDEKKIPEIFSFIDFEKTRIDARQIFDQTSIRINYIKNILSSKFTSDKTRTHFVEGMKTLYEKWHLHTPKFQNLVESSTTSTLHSEKREKNKMEVIYMPMANIEIDNNKYSKSNKNEELKIFTLPTQTTLKKGDLDKITQIIQYLKENEENIPKIESKEGTPKTESKEFFKIHTQKWGLNLGSVIMENIEIDFTFNELHTIFNLGTNENILSYATMDKIVKHIFCVAQNRDVVYRENCLFEYVLGMNQLKESLSGKQKSSPDEQNRVIEGIYLNAGSRKYFIYHTQPKKEASVIFSSPFNKQEVDNYKEVLFWDVFPLSEETLESKKRGYIGSTISYFLGFSRDNEVFSADGVEEGKYKGKLQLILLLSFYQFLSHNVKEINEKSIAGMKDDFSFEDTDKIRDWLTMGLMLGQYSQFEVVK